MLCNPSQPKRKGSREKEQYQVMPITIIEQMGYRVFEAPAVLGTVSRRASIDGSGSRLQEQRSGALESQTQAQAQTQTQRDGVKLEAGGSRVGIKVYEGDEWLRKGQGLTASQLSLGCG